MITYDELVAGHQYQALNTRMESDFRRWMRLVEAYTDMLREVEVAPQEDGMRHIAITEDKDILSKLKQWFAGSKVVDAEGRPLRLYHGSASSFDQFRIAKKARGNAFDRDSNIGIFLTDDPAQANYFAYTKGTAKAQAFGEPIGSNIMPLYVKMTNPYYFDAAHNFKQPDQMIKIASAARKAGHDGLIISNIYDAPIGQPTTLYVVFRPEQIKSVFAKTFNSTPKLSEHLL